MLQSASRLKHLSVHASDGDAGSISDFYFDDESWTIRYLVVDGGTWISGRRVLIAPVFLRQTDWSTGRLHVDLTTKQIQNSPSIDTQKPVSRQHEAEYFDYYAAPYYWSGGGLSGEAPFPGGLIVPPPEASEREAAGGNPPDSHLRSIAAVSGYHIEASDGAMGHVDDFIVDSGGWSIRYLQVATRDWLPGKKVLLAPEWVQGVSWDASTVFVDLPRVTIKESPEYTEGKLDRAYENELHRYYDRQAYWLREAGHARTDRIHAV